MSGSSAELNAFLEQYPDTRMLELLQPDMNGMLRGKRVARDGFEKVFTKGINNCAGNSLLDSKGEPFTRIPYGLADGDPDIYYRAVGGTLAPVPWALSPSGQVMLSGFNEDGSPFWGDPRQVLKDAIEPLEELGLTPVTAVELEFYLVEQRDGELVPRMSTIPGTAMRQDGSQYGSLEDLRDVDPFLAELDQTCRQQGLPAGTALSEFAPGQLEINLHHVADPLKACDHAVLLKRAVKAVAERHELAACFMAKPFAELAGSGMHLHVSLLDVDGDNVFAGTSRDGDFSDQLRFAVGGLLKTMAEGMAIFAPNANSYRRLQPKLYVPLTPNWGLNHRGVAVRLPLAEDRDKRLEHRVAGADANPYLVMAAVLAGIHHGLTRQTEPGEMVPQGAIIEEEITLPVRWEAALSAFDNGAVLRTYLGEQYAQVFATGRGEECDRFHSQVSNRDYEWYLRSV